MIYNESYNNCNNIFVFGSNRDGVHGKGAARQARDHWGATFGVGEGRSGMSYAIPTKSRWQDKKGLPLAKIEQSVDKFLAYAAEHPEFTFLVTRIGCGYAGYTDADIAPMFKGAPGNCVLPKEWTK